ncbi:MAG: hypothetical protein ACE5FP_08665, partial [Gemmatimonadota bacterium]
MLNPPGLSVSDAAPILCAMPLRIVRAGTSAALWNTCLESFLRSLGENAGPAPHASRLWVAHRTQRDATFKT